MVRLPNCSLVLARMAASRTCCWMAVPCSLSKVRMTSSSSSISPPMSFHMSPNNIFMLSASTAGGAGIGRRRSSSIAPNFAEITLERPYPLPPTERESRDSSNRACSESSNQTLAGALLAADTTTNILITSLLVLDVSVHDARHGPIGTDADQSNGWR